MAQTEKKADNIITSFSFFKSKEDKHEEAIELYEESYSQYLKNSDFKGALEIAKKIIKISNHKDFTNREYISNAADMYEKLHDTENCIKYLLILTDRLAINANNNNSLRVIKIWERIGVLYKLVNKYNNSIDAYNRAANLCYATNDYTRFCKFLLEIAKINIYENNYYEANNVLEKIIENCKTDLTKYYINEYCLYSLLIKLMIMAPEEVENKQKEYINTYNMFYKSTQSTLIKECIEAIKSNNVECFQQAVKMYESVWKNDNCLVKVLLKLKDSITNTSYSDDKVSLL